MTRWLIAVLLVLAAASPARGHYYYLNVGNSGLSAGWRATRWCVTPAGTNSAPAFTGTAFDPHPAFTRVIFCKKS